MFRKSLFCILLIALGTTEVRADAPWPWYNRLYVDFGFGGYPYITYGSSFDSVLSSYAISGRNQYELDVHLGWAITRNLCLVAGEDLILDRMYANGIETAENVYFTSLGIRASPSQGRPHMDENGLLLGADAGMSAFNSTSAVGVGFGGVAAWRFYGFQAGVKALFLTFGNSSPSYMFGVMPYIDFQLLF